LRSGSSDLTFLAIQDQETGDLSPPTKKMKKSSPKSSAIIEWISQGIQQLMGCTQTVTQRCMDVERNEGVCCALTSHETCVLMSIKCALSNAA
jgi:hypothetical protein